jgi:hypothetical protein
MMHRCATPIIPGIDAIALRDLQDDDAIMHRSLEIIERRDIIHDLNHLWRMLPTTHTGNNLEIVCNFSPRSSHVQLVGLTADEDPVSINFAIKLKMNSSNVSPSSPRRG